MKHELREKTLVELCDLLVDKTMLLLKEMEQKNDPARFHVLKQEVELIQFEIKAKQATNGLNDGKRH